MVKDSEMNVARNQMRALLQKVGLAQEEADAFLERLSDDKSVEAESDEAVKLREVERLLNDIKQAQQQTPGRREAIITALAAGEAVNRFDDWWKTQLHNDHPPLPPTLEVWLQAIAIDWAGGEIPKSLLNAEPAIRRALELHPPGRSSSNLRAAILSDGMGMYLDAKKRHQQAYRYRQLALRFATCHFGANHEFTGAALSNVGLNLFQQRRFAESEKYLSKSLKVLLATIGPNHITTSASIYNIYYTLSAQRRFPHKQVPTQFRQNLPEIRQTATLMMARKFVQVTLLAIKELADSLIDDLRA